MDDHEMDGSGVECSTTSSASSPLSSLYSLTFLRQWLQHMYLTALLRTHHSTLSPTKIQEINQDQFFSFNFLSSPVHLAYASPAFR